MPKNKVGQHACAWATRFPAEIFFCAIYSKAIKCISSFMKCEIEDPTDVGVEIGRACEIEKSVNYMIVSRPRKKCVPYFSSFSLLRHSQCICVCVYLWSFDSTIFFEFGQMNREKEQITTKKKTDPAQHHENWIGKACVQKRHTHKCSMLHFWNVSKK